MNRRSFLSLAFSAIPVYTIAREIQKNKMDFVRWIWMHSDCTLSAQDWQQRFSHLKHLGIKRIHLEVYTGTKAFFKTSVPCEMPCDLLDRILPVARKAGIEIHAWIWVLMNNNPVMIDRHRDWYVVNRLGQSCIDNPPYVKYYRWLCPSKPQVRDYLLHLIDDLAAYPDLAGIHLDYIRFPDVILPIGFQPKYNLVQKTEMPQFDYCYCETCRTDFKNEHGFDPMELEDPAQNVLWRAFRERQITQLVNTLVPHIQKTGQMASAAVFPTPTIARKLVRQNWPQWNLEAFFPMMYHPFYHKSMRWLYEATQEGVQAIRTGQIIYSGIYVPAFTPEELAESLRLIRKAGGAGVSFFDYDALMKREKLISALYNAE